MQPHLAYRHRLWRMIAGWLVAVGQPGITPSFAQAPAALSGQRSTELFNRVMDDVLGRRLTVRLTERDPGNGARPIGILEVIRSATSWKAATR